MPDESKRTNCPRCAASLGGRLVAWRLLDSEEELELTEKVVPVRPPRGIDTRSAATVMVERERERVRVTQETFNETFHCLHCGHTWSQNLVKLRKSFVE